jgi:hypothetical protein
MRAIVASKNLAFTLTCRNLSPHLNRVFVGAFVVAEPFGIMAFGPSAEAGFFDELFAGGEPGNVHQTPVAPPNPRSRNGRSEIAHRHLARVETQLSYLHPRTRRRRNIYAAADATGNGVANETKRVQAQLCYTNGRPNQVMDQSEAILHDHTLRPGDSVMTAQGVRVFRGRSARPHKPSEFLSLADARDLSSTKRGALSAIEQATKATHGRDLTSIVVRVDKPATPQ